MQEMGEIFLYTEYFIHNINHPSKETNLLKPYVIGEVQTDNSQTLHVSSLTKGEETKVKTLFWIHSLWIFLTPKHA